MNEKDLVQCRMSDKFDCHFEKPILSSLQNGETVTAGNASGINDSAAAVLLMSEAEVQKRSIKPLAKIIAFAQSGIEPEIMGMGPVSAVNEVVSFKPTSNVYSLYYNAKFYRR